MQVVGMLGLIQTIRRTSGWAVRLMSGKIERLDSLPPPAAFPSAALMEEPPAIRPMKCRPRCAASARSAWWSAID